MNVIFLFILCFHSLRFSDMAILRLWWGSDSYIIGGAQGMQKMEDIMISRYTTPTVWENHRFKAPLLGFSEWVTGWGKVFSPSWCSCKHRQWNIKVHSPSEDFFCVSECRDIANQCCVAQLNFVVPQGHFIRFLRITTAFNIAHILDTMYYWDADLSAQNPAHDPCGSNYASGPGHKMGVANPSGAIFLR